MCKNWWFIYRRAVQKKARSNKQAHNYPGNASQSSWLCCRSNQLLSRPGRDLKTTTEFASTFTPFGIPLVFIQETGSYLFQSSGFAIFIARFWKLCPFLLLSASCFISTLITALWSANSVGGRVFQRCLKRYSLIRLTRLPGGGAFCECEVLSPARL